MKVRLHVKQLRFRLSPEEVAQLTSKCALQEDLFVGEQRLSYGIAVDAEAQAVKASFDGQQILVILPSAEVSAWADSAEEGIRADQDGLEILIEKDRGERRPSAS
jgi:hypothetical protein